MDENRFQMRQCHDEVCRFRFPAPVAATAVDCPRCGGPTERAIEFAGRGAPAQQPNSTVVLEALLDNIRSIYNVGAMLRTADGAGLRRLHLCGITATPDHPKVAKTALGAQEAVPWVGYANALDAADSLRQQGYELWGLESGPRAESLFAVQTLPQKVPLVLVVGNEVAGIDPALLERCSRVLAIPMHGVKGSLNAAVAFGIAVYHLHYGVPA
ncbi:MAG: TrmH family RNA methyltransferase [Anaerolineae bacterium]|nr:TrmH family RNA methyltransferase [Anaerolineae bacterium]